MTSLSPMRPATQLTGPTRDSLYALVLLLAGCKGPAETPAAPSASTPTPDPAPNVELVLASGPAVLDDVTTRALAARVERALAVCNFTSRAKPEIFAASDLGALWQERQRGAHLFLRYPLPKRIDSVAGPLSIREVMLSVGQPYGPEPALIRDSQGLVGLKKCGYDDRWLGCDPALAAHFPKPDVCPPGL